MIDVNQNLCTPSRVHSCAIWLEDVPAIGGLLPDPDTEGDDAGDDGRPVPGAAAARDSAEAVGEDTSADGSEGPVAEAVGDAASDAGPAGPMAHPDQALFDLALTRQQLPAPSLRTFQEQLGQALAQAADVFNLMGLSPEESLTEARSAAWTYIRDMKPLDVQRAKRQKFLTDEPSGPPSMSCKGWY